jgi:hypothetical protein
VRLLGGPKAQSLKGLPQPWVDPKTGVIDKVKMRQGRQTGFVFRPIIRSSILGRAGTGSSWLRANRSTPLRRNDGRPHRVIQITLDMLDSNQRWSDFLGGPVDPTLIGCYLEIVPADFSDNSTRGFRAVPR